MELVETLNRTIKLAMDDGRVASYEEAQALFRSFRLRISVQPGFAVVPAAQAVVLTLLNAAPKTFLGGVELTGPLEERCTMAWFTGRTLGEIAQNFGVVAAKEAQDDEIPTIYIGEKKPPAGEFCLGVVLEADGFMLSPDRAALGSAEATVKVGVAAAGAALNEAFQHAYRRAPLAGQRDVRWHFPAGARPQALPCCWLVGLGHLGQAFLWTAALAGGKHLPRVMRLSDYDTLSRSSLSTCLLVNAQDVGRKKVDVIAERLEALGVEVQRDFERLDLGAGLIRVVHELAVVAVDNVALRRSLDRLRGDRVLEAGIGDGVDGFTRVQLHAFPGPRKACDIWVGNDERSSRIVDVSKPAYRSLLAQSGDECGTTLVAGRSVATPFVGAFAGAVLFWLAENPPTSDHAWNFDVNSL